MDKMKGFLRKNVFYVLMAVLVAGIITATGIAAYVSDHKGSEVAENAADFKDAETNTGTVENYAASAGTANETQMDYTEGYNADDVQKALSAMDESAAEAAAQAEAEQTGAEAAEASADILSGFDAGAKMTWPVSGEIVLDYSMDTTIFFPTLKAYRCNPAVLIQGEVNAPVEAAYAGTVTDVLTDEVYGTVVAVSMGSGYTAYYGQVKDVQVAAGDTVAAGEVIASISEPTRFFTVEGSHVNFKLTKDEIPQDPKDYLE